jgi:hypothetical protein
MDHESVLHLTGGLPPSAFSLQPSTGAFAEAPFNQGIDGFQHDLTTESNFPIYCTNCNFPGCFGVDCKPLVSEECQLDSNFGSSTDEAVCSYGMPNSDDSNSLHIPTENLDSKFDIHCSPLDKLMKVFEISSTDAKESS